MIMTKGTRTFRLIISILLGITMLWTAFMSYAFIYVTKENEALKRNQRFGLYVAGIDVTMGNAYDILGDGTVSYNEVSNVLTLNNATIECDGSAIYSQIDLTVELIGENKFIRKGKELTYALYASDRSLQKDLAIQGDGSLEIMVDDPNCRSISGIIADDLWIRADVSITLANAAESTHGISCEYLNLGDEQTLSVRVGSAETSSGIYARSNISVGENATLNVIGTASTEESWGIECAGIFTARENATINAKSGGDRAGIVCYSTLLDYGATINSEVDIVDGVQDLQKP